MQVRKFAEKKVRPELKASRERSKKAWLKIRELIDVLQDTKELEKMFMALLKDLDYAFLEVIKTFLLRLSMT